MFGFSFGFRFCKRLYNQIINIYKINTHINLIYNSFNESDIKQKENFESLKQIIFSCGSLYIKCFQWYISKIKSNIIDINYTVKKNLADANTDLDININKSKQLLKFIKYFEDIFEQCPYHDIEHTKKVFCNSMFGITLDSYIDMNTFKSIASGSIGQVYYARRKTDNLEIAIKIKHPNITEDLANQYEIITFFKIIQKIPFLRNYYNLYFNIDDFLLDINLQCDFNNEANNCKIFQDNFKDSSNHIVFPKIIYQSNDLLISEFIDGESFEDLTDMQKYQTSINFMCFFYQMLLVDNFIHGDLHCKNWKIKNNKETNTIQIVVYDCGICFKNSTLELSTGFWFALINYDIESLNNILITFISETTNNNNLNIDKIKKDINVLFYNILNKSVSTSFVLISIINFFRSNNIIVHKFLLNLSILVCVIEEFLKENSLINKDKNNIKRTSMFEIVCDSQLDVIAFCDVKKCYSNVSSLFSLDMNNKYSKYKSNILKNNITETANNDKKLFSNLSISTLKFRPPE